MMLAVLNGILVIPFTIPVLIPTLCIATPSGQFGCIQSMEIVWPGTWLLVGYFFFVIVGILGALAWSWVYQQKAALEGKTQARGSLVWTQLILFEIGVLGATSLMAAIGYAGGNILAHGGGVAISAEAIRTEIIPPLSSDPTNVLWDMPPVVEAIFVGISLLAQLVGVFNLFTLKKGPSPP